MTSTLQQLGLSKNEAKIYQSLLKSGPVLITTIARNTGLHRPVTYRAIRSLEESGFVTAAPKGRRTYFAPESPQKLRNLAMQFTQSFENLLPRLEKDYRSSSVPIVKFLHGNAGIRAAFDDLLKTLKRGETYFRYSSRKRTTASRSHLPRNYEKIRDNKRIERLVITGELQNKNKRPSLTRHTKVVPPQYDLFQHDVSLLIYGPKIAYIDYNSETSLIIENPTMATFHRKLFKLLYDRL